MTTLEKSLTALSERTGLVTNSLDAFERYYDFKPLNPELAAILAGKMPPEAPPGR